MSPKGIDGYEDEAECDEGQEGAQDEQSLVVAGWHRWARIGTWCCGRALGGWGVGQVGNRSKVVDRVVVDWAELPRVITASW